MSQGSQLELKTDSAKRTLLPVKAVPGASRDAISGVLGGRLKVRVSAPPEGGKANRAICALLAKALGVKRGEVEIVSGQTSAEKVVGIGGVAPREVVSRLGLGEGE